MTTNTYKRFPGEPEVKDILKDPKNALNIFNESLTDEERKMGIKNLSTDRKYEYIVALFNFQLQAIPSMADCAFKTQILFSNTLASQNIENFELNVSFRGTIENVKNEDFHFVFSEVKNIEEYKQLEKEEEAEIQAINQIIEEQYAAIANEGINEYFDDDDNLENPEEDYMLTKFDLLINQKDVVLNIFEQIKEKINDPSEREVCLATAGFLVVAEFLSLADLEFQKSLYENLMDGEIKSNKNYEARVYKKTIDFQLTNFQKTSNFLH